jgi:hypothetical protein
MYECREMMKLLTFDIIPAPVLVIGSDLYVRIAAQGFKLGLLSALLARCIKLGPRPT